ncbi:hypothetical protein [Arcticibacter eurypsychrophilus]|uniref:hypothetical protein n=1 Tax=Arcticibacter eurypsychrophilus TaxID=1434752 RepID=UPI00084DC04C|nr:hypothetical protein [Arcticibacter eurypsychrophilus]
MADNNIGIYDDQDDQNNADETTNLDKAEVNKDESETEDTEIKVNAQPLTTQGDEAEIEKFMAATTNLSLDQLKKEGGPQSNDDTDETAE